METPTLRHNGPEDRETGTTVRLEVRPDAVVRARSGVAQAAVQAAMTEDRVDDLVIAVSEAVTNAIESQLRSGATAPVEVTWSNADGIFEVAIADRGGGFAPERLAARPPLSSPNHLDIERGWGIQLMRALVDELVFEPAGEGTCVRIRMAVP